MKRSYNLGMILFVFTLFLSIIITVTLKNEIKNLEALLAEYHVNAVTEEVIRYNYVDVEVDDVYVSDKKYEAYQEGYNEGYNAGMNDMIDYFDSYVGTDEFYNDYGLTP